MQCESRSWQPGSRSAIAAAGAIPAVVQLLGSHHKKVQQQAAAALHDLALGSSDKRSAFAAAGGIPSAAVGQRQESRHCESCAWQLR